MSDLMSVIIELKKQLEEKQKIIDEQLEIIKFYGDINNWVESHCQSCPSMGNGEDIEDYYPKSKYGFIGGKKAREFLQRMESEK